MSKEKMILQNCNDIKQMIKICKNKLNELEFSDPDVCSQYDADEVWNIFSLLTGVVSAEVASIENEAKKGGKG